MRNTIYKDEDFHLECAESAGEIVLHCEVTNWTLSSFKKGIKIFSEYLNNEAKRGTKAVYTITPNPKFASLLGGVPICSIEVNNNKYEVFKWDLTQ